MSSTIQILIQDDLDGSPAVETVRFGIDGSMYEIDLSKRNAAALRQMLSRYIKAARPVRGGARATATPRGTRAGRAAAAPRTGPTTAARRPAAGRAGAGAGRAAAGRAGTRPGGRTTAASRGTRAGVKGRRTATASARVRAASGAGNPAAVREWAKQQGIAVSQRGRISSQILNQYAQATKS